MSWSALCRCCCTLTTYWPASSGALKLSMNVIVPDGPSAGMWSSLRRNARFAEVAEQRRGEQHAVGRRGELGDVDRLGDRYALQAEQGDDVAADVGRAGERALELGARLGLVEIVGRRHRCRRP